MKIFGGVCCNNFVFPSVIIVGDNQVLCQTGSQTVFSDGRNEDSGDVLGHWHGQM
jgi:hypothetical protein